MPAPLEAIAERLFAGVMAPLVLGGPSFPATPSARAPRSRWARTGSRPTTT